MPFTYTAASLYDQIKQELGGADPTTAQENAIKNRIQEGAIDIWHDGPWSWRKKRMDVKFTTSTPYYELPTDYDAMSLTEIYRTDSDDGESHRLALATDAEFEREYHSASFAEPFLFRITRRELDSAYKYVLEGAPPADDTYEYSDVEYFCAAPEIDFGSSTAVNMPTEFHDLWHERALADASDVLGMSDTSERHMQKYMLKLDRARARRDQHFPKGPPRAVADPYDDLSRLRL